MNDPRYGVARILRPYPEYQTRYQGQSAGRPVMFTEGGVELDVDAVKRTIGFAPQLLKGTPVSFGQNIVLYIPKVRCGDADEQYIVSLVWRLRNLRDYQENKVTPYQLPRSSFGQPVGTDPRYVIPCGSESFKVDPSLPAQIYNKSQGSITSTETRIYTGGIGNPVPSTGLPMGFTHFQQGVLPPIFSTLAFGDYFNILETKARGNELLIGIHRTSESTSKWGFAQGEADSLFGITFDSEYDTSGIYMIPGVE